jgi:hypothetical protein
MPWDRPKDQINLHMINKKEMRQHTLKMKSHGNSLFYFQDGGNYGTKGRIKREKSARQESRISQKTIMNIASS